MFISFVGEATKPFARLCVEIQLEVSGRLLTRRLGTSSTTAEVVKTFAVNKHQP